jgi:hypothetical protein
LHFYFSGVPFNELTLWRFFDCLLDGICALEYGYEAHYDMAKEELWPERPKNWVPMVHFDLKPDNGQ